MSPTDLIDEFLTDYKEREMFSSTEIVDFLLDLRLTITAAQHTTQGDIYGSIQKGTATPDRSDPDDGQSALSSTIIETVG